MNKENEIQKKKVKVSIEEKYPLGMTPYDIANEIEGLIEDGSFTDQMPNINLSTAESIEDALIEGQVPQIKNILLDFANKTNDTYKEALAFELYDQINKYQNIEPIKINDEKQITEEDIEHEEITKKESKKKENSILKTPLKKVKEDLGLDIER